jgi:hypothetical protein
MTDDMKIIQRRKSARPGEFAAGARSASGWRSASRMQIAADSVIELPSGKIRTGTWFNGLMSRKAWSGGSDFGTSIWSKGMPAKANAASTTKPPVLGRV